MERVQSLGLKADRSATEWQVRGTPPERGRVRWSGGSVGSSPRWPWTWNKLLGLRVVRLEDLIRQRPCWRNPVLVTDLAEIPLAQSQRVRRHTPWNCRRRSSAALDERYDRPSRTRFRATGRRRPQRPFAHPSSRGTGQIVAALEQQYPLTGRRKSLCHRGPARSATDDDGIIVRIAFPQPPVANPG